MQFDRDYCSLLKISLFFCELLNRLKVTLSSLYSNTARTIEDALGEAIREASRAGKAVLYLPDLCALWDALPENAPQFLKRLDKH